MGLFDPVKQSLASYLAKSKSEDLEAGQERQTPEMRQRTYDAGRRSILGDFTAADPKVVQACSSAKAARRQERLDLVSRAIVTCPEHAGTAARLRRDMDEVENMRCARHVYATPKSDLGPAPPGFREPTEEDLARMGLTKDMLESSDRPGFRAAVYIKDPDVWGPDPDPAAVLAFRGSTPERVDWENNFAQGMNLESPYYRQAVTIGDKLAASGAKVQIAGHSLGGGLASAAQGASGLPCSTYNAAGLHPETVRRYLGPDQAAPGDPSAINAIRVRGEVLTATQEEGVLGWFAHDAVGQKRDLPPPLTPEEFAQKQDAGLIDIREDYATHLHGMDVVIESMEQQKTADQAALRACLEKSA